MKKSENTEKKIFRYRDSNRHRRQKRKTIFFELLVNIALEDTGDFATIYFKLLWILCI